MKEVLLQFAQYNLWANRLILQKLMQLEPEQLEAQWPSSFRSFRKTVEHMWVAEEIWWQRIKLEEKVISPLDSFKGDFQDLTAKLTDMNNRILKFVENSQIHHLEHVFHYQNSKKEQFKQPVYQVLLHVFNHATYHRGQIINMLRQAGVEKLPETDFVVLVRRK